MCIIQTRDFSTSIRDVPDDVVAFSISPLLVFQRSKNFGFHRLDPNNLGRYRGFSFFFF